MGYTLASNMQPQNAQDLEAGEDFLHYEMTYLTEYFQNRAKSELFEEEETRDDKLKQFRSLLDAEPNLKYQDDDLFLLSFLRARKFDLGRAFNMMKLFYSTKDKRGELYYDFDYEDVKRTIETNGIGFLPYRDSEGSVILVIRVEPWNPQVNSMGDVMRTLTSGLLHAILSPATQIAGFKVIVDLKGLSKFHLPYVSPTYLWLLAEALQNCFPGRFRALHMVNEGPFFSCVWFVLRQFLKKKMKDRFHFHGKNMKSLHKYFSPKIMPAEFEGELPPFDYSEWGKMMEENAEYFCYVYSHGYQKQKSKFNS